MRIYSLSRQIRRSEDFIQDEATHRCSIAQLLRSSSPSLSEAQNDMENQATIPTITKVQYWSDFITLEDKIVHDMESPSSQSSCNRLTDPDESLNYKLSD